MTRALARDVLRRVPLREVRAALAALPPLAAWPDQRLAAVIALGISLRESGLLTSSARVLQIAASIVAEPRDNPPERIAALASLDARFIDDLRGHTDAAVEHA